MSRPGDEVRREATGERYVGRRSAEEGGTFEFDYYLCPGAAGPPEHSHDSDEESFEMVTGTLRVWVDGVERTVRAGDRFRVPPRTRHRFRNDGKEEVHLRISFPGPGFERVVDGLLASARAPRGLTNGLRMAVHAREHIGSARPSSPFLRLAIHVVGGLGSALGLRPVA